ncbi:MAG: DUF2202 domain-containing protein [Caldisericia bacterium]|nr:DUF2202 domain-containing protein [Caldisericia bacterium]
MKNRYPLSVSFFVVAISLLVTTAFLLTACNSSDQNGMITDLGVARIPIDFNVDFEPEPLKEPEKVLSQDGYGAKGALSDEDLTIHDMLTYAVQDEYLAHAEYIAIMEKFGQMKPYINIAKSEETHLSFLEEVYLSFDMEFPEDTSAQHVVIPENLLEAAKVGVQAEIENIAMYELFMTHELPDNVYEVFYVLKSGSENHLKAFQKQVERLS